MKTITNAPCSPYISRPQSSLRQACHESGRDMGRTSFRCGRCSLRDLCEPQPTIIALPAKRTVVAGLPAVIIDERKVAA